MNGGDGTDGGWDRNRTEIWDESRPPLATAADRIDLSAYIRHITRFRVITHRIRSMETDNTRSRRSVYDITRCNACDEMTVARKLISANDLN
ncbi:hypothetical protein EVAR_54914_1 [Eumeta japonica]|uniref:Uncharacterized protein n=1 Tax=Eumeta variegata TaxID=151549 RepID=A0A4C1Z2P3_EUMVA|nr:hypothetical protein EVAR_54914_1 [Eumeta japonica]